MRPIALVVFPLALLLASTGSAAADAARDQQFVQAVKTGNSRTAFALIDERVDPNAAERDGTTALHWAVRNNDLAMVDRLIAAGADVHAANRYGITAIYLACQNGSAGAVQRLLEGGVRADTTGQMGETALHTCARTGRPEAAQRLIDAGAPIDPIESWRGQTPLMWAAANRNPEMMRTLIAAGADVNARSTIIEWERQRTQEPRDKWLPPGGLTPLLLAAREGCAACIEVLAEAGADLNIVTPELHSGLVVALMNGHFDAAGALIRNGADVNLADRVGRTALYAAVDAHTPIESGRPAPQDLDNQLSAYDIIKMALAHGADIDATLRQSVPYRTKLDRGGDTVLGAGTTPLIRAAKAADVQVVRLLLEHGADPLAATRNGVNALMMAANVAAREEDMTGRDKNDRTIIETIDVLLEAGVDINASDTSGRTAVHGAALWGLTDVIRFLHAQGARLDVKEKRGFTPYDMAMGRAGGFGFGGTTGYHREDTAAAILELYPAAADADIPAPPEPEPDPDWAD
jgi:uncharacterized protein